MFDTFESFKLSKQSKLFEYFEQFKPSESLFEPPKLFAVERFKTSKTFELSKQFEPLYTHWISRDFGEFDLSDRNLQYNSLSLQFRLTEFNEIFSKKSSLADLRSRRDS